MTSVQTGSSTALAEQVQGAVVAGARPGGTLMDKIRGQGPELEKALPKGTLDPERFLRTVLTEVRKTPKLQECTAESFLGAMMQVAQLGLEIGNTLGHTFLIPYVNRRMGITECQLQIGYKGYIELAYRGGIILEAREVYEHDDFDFDFAAEPPYHHRWKLGKNRGELIGFYGTAKLPDGRTKFHVMDLDEIEKRRARAQAKDNGPWKTDYVAMCRKTTIRAMIPQMPLSTESQKLLGEAAKADDATIRRDRQGELKVTYSEPEETGATPILDATPTTVASATGDAITDALNAIEPNAARLECSREVLRVFGPPTSLPENQRQAVLAIVQGWPESKSQLEGFAGASGHALTSSEVVTPTEVVGGASQSVLDEILDGLPAAEAAEAEAALEGRFGQEYDGNDEQIQNWLGEWIENRGEAPAANAATGEIVDNVRSAGGDVPDDMLEGTKKLVGYWDTDKCKEMLGLFGLPRTGNLESMRARLIVHIAPLRAAGDPAVKDLF